MNRNEISMHRQDVGNQNARSRFLLVTLQWGCPLNRYRLAAGYVELESSSTSLQCEWRLGAILVEVNANRDSFGQHQMDQPEWIRQGRRKIPAGANPAIQKLKLEKGNVYQEALS